ncbi:MAG TPA: TetR/AcrR family transcriptional regulator [Solirubrobacteraceae bacterium]|jgi:AcrR family transcriptional regulator|nr:TetR/AcrR family transcriptional regulator [Solirubrobacteraceae bacterium]
MRTTSSREAVKRRHVPGIQRARILEAVCDICCEEGAGRVTVAEVVRRARVSRGTFYELFGDRERCLRGALEDAAARAGKRVLAAYDADAPWAQRIRAALVALLQFIEEEPGMGRLLIVESLAAGPLAGELRMRLLADLVAALDRGREQAKGDILPLSAEASVGSVLFVLGQRLGEPDAPTLVELINPLMSLIVLPYLGAAAARAELACPPVAARPARPSPRNAPSDPQIRLTYRTMGLLLAIGARPGSSNREVGNAAGVLDAGQISKLLTRMRRLGLIENREGAGVSGRPNAWTLTSKGAEVQRTIAAHQA